MESEHDNILFFVLMEVMLETTVNVGISLREMAGGYCRVDDLGIAFDH